MKFEKRFKEFVHGDLGDERTSLYWECTEITEAYAMLHTWRYRTYFSSIGPSQEPLRILDIGTTPFTFFLKDCYPDYEIATCDLTDVLQDRCEARDIRFAKVDLTSEPIPFPNDFFHIVIIAEVLEHLFAPPSRIVKEIHRILQPRGTLIFSVPNLASLSHRIELLLGISPLVPPDQQMTPRPQTGYPHLREYTMSECVPILEGCGFTIESKRFLRPGVLYLATVERVRVTRRMVKMAYSMLCSLLPSFGSEICIKAKKD